MASAQMQDDWVRQTYRHAYLLDNSELSLDLSCTLDGISGFD